MPGMMTRHCMAAAGALSLSLLGGCSDAPTVSFRSDVAPILAKYCAECHVGNGEGTQASEFRVDSYENVIKGTKYGPVIVAGDPLSSSLYRLVSGKVDPSIQMPHGKESLSAGEIAMVEHWIAQGARDN